MKRILGCAIALSLMLVASLAADVQTQQKSQLKFEGVLGRMYGLFGGKTAKEGLVQTMAVSGDRKVVTSENTAQIIDLAEEKIYDLDLRNKSYKVTTFDELRRQMQEAAARAQKSEGRKSDEPQKEYETDVDVKDTGQRKTVNGFDSGETIVTITVHEKGKTVDQAGGIILTADVWLTKAVPAMKEMMEFDRKYAEKLLGGDTAQQMAAATAMYPGLKDAMAKWQANGAKMDGTPIQTTLTFAAAKTAEQQANEQKAGEQKGGQGGMGGVLGGLGSRFGRKKADQPAAAPADNSRATIMTMITEVMSVSTSVDKAALAVPAGFKQK